MDNLPTLTKHPELVTNGSSKYIPVVHETGVLLHSAAYAGLQSPLNAVVQPFGGKQDSFIAQPEKTKTWSLDWNLQQIGTGVGMLLPILASRKLVTTAFPSATAELAASKGIAALTSAEARSLARYELGVATSTGLVYGGLLTPSQLEPGQSLLDARMRQSAAAGATFLTLSLSSQGLKNLGQQASLKETGIGRLLKNDTAVMAISGVPAAVVSVDAHSVVQGKGMPSLKEHFDSKYLEAIYNFSVVGAGLGYLTGPRALNEREGRALNEREPAGKTTLERQASDNAIANKSSSELLKELTTKFEATKVPELMVDAVPVPKVQYERDVRDLPQLKKGANEKEASADLREFEQNSIEKVATPVRVYEAEGSPVKVIVPEQYALQLDRLAELQKQAAGKGAAAERARNELEKPEMQELAARMTVADAFKTAHLTPSPGQFREIYLFGNKNPYDAWYKARNGDPTFESAGDTVFKTGQTSWYRKNSSATLLEDMMHEWSHLFDENFPVEAQMIRAANRIDNLETRSYAQLPREQLAILLGEYALHQNGQRAAQLMEKAPATATAIGEALHSVLSRTPESQRSAIHQQLLDRANLMRNEAGPVAKQKLLETIKQDPASAEAQNALRALVYIGKAEDLAGLKGISTVDLSYEPLMDSMGARVARLPDLKNLDLSSTYVAAETMRALDGKPLQSLSLAGTRVTNASLSLLPKTLERLDLSGTRISDQAIPFLQRLQGLKSLDVNGTLLTGPGIARLKAALANTDVLD